MIKEMKDLQIAGKRVLIRVDFNVPLTKEGMISDDSRIRAALPTIVSATDRGAKVVLMSHLGRPKGRTATCTLKPCAIRLSELLSKPVRFVEDCVGPIAEQAVREMKDGDVILLENLRFYEAEEHPEKDPEFVKKLAQLGDCYVNDAFGTAHRAHASTACIAALFPGQSAAGELMMKEVQALSAFLRSPKRPFVAIIGGAKISTKLGVLRSLIHVVDTLLIGGAMAYTFMRALGLSTGTSPVEESMIDEAKSIVADAKKDNKRLCLPVDCVVAAEFLESAASRVISSTDGIPDGFEGMDIGPRTVEEWRPIIQEAKTIFWNGPVGVFEFAPFARGTQAIAQIIAGCPNCFSVVGGGDSIAALEQFGIQGSVSHVSTGGGASLEFIEHGTLPGLEALEASF